MWLYARPIPEHGRDAQHQAAYALLELAVRRHYGIAMPTIAKGDHGKPYFPDYPEIAMNLSHCSGMAVCLIGAAKTVGVDVEEIRPRRQGALRRAFSTAEAEFVENSRQPDEMFFRLWTLKESYVKALGIGISYPLREVCFSLANGEIAANVSGFCFCQFRLERWIIGVCVPAGSPLPTYPFQIS